MKSSSSISEFLNFVLQTEKEYRSTCEAAEKCNKKIEDLLHDIEFAQNKRECNKASWETHQYRVLRRTHKDKLAELSPIVNFINDNKKAIEKLKQVLGEVRKAEELNSSERKYYPRMEAFYGKGVIR